MREWRGWQSPICGWCGRREEIESPNIHNLIMLNVPLCAACEDCGHRTLISGHQLASRRFLRGNMTAISSLRLRCGECGSRRVGKVIPRDMAEAGRFVAGV